MVSTLKIIDNVLPQLLQLYRVIVIKLVQEARSIPYIEGAKPNLLRAQARIVISPASYVDVMNTVAGDRHARPKQKLSNVAAPYMSKIRHSRLLRNRTKNE
jgi:hypothetical protein